MNKLTILYTKGTRGKNKGKWLRPNLNDYVLACRTSSIAGSRYAKRFKLDFINQINAQCPERHSKPVQITWHYYEPDKRRDLDNIEFARKFVQDALVATGVIPNDGQKWVVSYGKPEFHVDRHNPRIEVFIREEPCN